MSIFEHLDKNNLHHAYLIEGAREEIAPLIFEFMNDLGILTSSNPDFCQITIDSFKMEDALALRAMGYQKGLTAGKKVFLISANSFSLDSQQALLKMFEEPIENTIFFLVVPDVAALLKTLVSRFYHISTRKDLAEEKKEAEKFIGMPLTSRIEFLKELLADDEEESEEARFPQDSARSKSLKFINALENVLHDKFVTKVNFTTDKQTDLSYFDQIFKVREFLRQPGSSAKSLMESVALAIPKF